MNTRDVLKGFFGWFLFGNIIFVIYLMALFRIPVNLRDSVAIIIVWLPTVVASLVLFARKRIWIGSGVVSAVIINAGTWLLCLSSWGLIDFTTEMLTVLGIPLPCGLVLFMLAQ
jgi:hypothetical protein